MSFKLRILGSFLTKASMLIPKESCSCVCLYNLFKTTLALASLFNSIDLITEIAKNLQIDKASGQASLFDINESRETDNTIELPDIDNWTYEEKLNNEKKILGVFITGHPLEKYQDDISNLPCTPIAELTDLSNNDEVSIIGIITNLKVRTSKNGKIFASANIEDTGGIIEAIFFPNVYEKCGSIIETIDPLIIKGRIVHEDDNTKKIIVKEVQDLENARMEAISGIHINFNIENPDEKLLKNLKTIIVNNAGNNSKCPVYFHLNGNNGDQKIIKAHPAFNAEPSKKLKAELSDIVGHDAVYYSIAK